MGRALGGGSGWVLLSWSPRDRKLVNQWASDHCHTLAGGTPVLALDMYEHSYHIDFGAKPAAYVDAFMAAIRWTNSDRLFGELSRYAGTQPGHGPTGGSHACADPLLTASAVLLSAPVWAQETDWQQVDTVFGRKAAVSADVHRYGFPRTDLSVTLDGVVVKPALALGGWVAFKPLHGGAMIMGDLVLLETEINPVMAKLIEGGLQITAVHNHLLRANPATFYMHVGGHGDPAKVAAVIREALSESKTPLSVPAVTSAAPAADLDTAQLDQTIGAKGQSNGGVYQFGVPRRGSSSCKRNADGSRGTNGACDSN